MFNGTWPVVIAACGETLGMALFTAGFWMINDLRYILLGRPSKYGQPNDPVFAGAACLLAGLVLAFGMLAVQAVVAAGILLAILITDTAVAVVLLQRRSRQRQEELASILTKKPDEL